MVNHICSTEICDSKKVCRKTESVAMADYFHKGLEGSKQGKALIKGVLTIDIGGGSTVISVRKGQDKDKTLIEIHQCSFKFAGNDIFSNYVKCKYKTKNDLLSPLGRYDDSLQGELEKLSSFAKNTQWKAFELELEFILKNFDTELKKGMDVANQNTEIGKGLNIVMRDIAFSLGGIMSDTKKTLPLWTRDFTIITLGSVVSMFGNSMSGFAMSLMVLLLLTNWKNKILQLRTIFQSALSVAMDPNC